MTVNKEKKYIATSGNSIGVEEKIVEEYLNGSTIAMLIKKYRISYETVTSLILSRGHSLRTAVETRRITSGLTIDYSAFEDFEDKETQYFYGLILSDGYLRGNSITFCIKDTDSEILYKFQKYLGMNYGLHFSEIYDKRTLKTYKRCTLTCSEKRIVDRLKLQGITKSKSCEEVLPKFDWLNSRDFWRGVIDGDGHIRLKETRALVLVGSEEVVTGFISFCNNFNLLGTPRKPSSKFYKNKELFKVQLTGDDAERVARFLYRDNDLALKRKLSTVLEYPTKLKNGLEL